jgi:peptidoglycan hydrolase-like protein with peptidoglycan-binding domain
MFGVDPGPVDGVFGPMTTAAVRGFQASAGIDVDGLVGSGTRERLSVRLLSVSEVLRSGDRSDAVRLLQEHLRNAGHDPGPVDGIFGALTLRAVNGFQEREELTVDGVVGPQTWSALLG